MAQRADTVTTGNRGRERKGKKMTKGIGKICHSPQWTKLAFRPGHRDSLDLHQAAGAMTMSAVGKSCYGALHAVQIT